MLENSKGAILFHFLGVRLPLRDFKSVEVLLSNPEKRKVDTLQQANLEFQTDVLPSLFGVDKLSQSVL